MTEKHFIALLFFLISSFSLIAMFREVLPNENSELIDEKNNERVKVSIQNQSSLIDSITPSKSEEIKESSKKEIEKTKEVVVLINSSNEELEADEIVLENIEEYSLEDVKGYSLEVYEEVKDSIVETVSETTSEVLDNIEESSTEIVEEVKDTITGVIIEKIVIPIEISYDSMVEKINNDIIKPFETRFNDLAKKFLSILLSLLSPEDVREILDDANICKI